MASRAFSPVFRQLGQMTASPLRATRAPFSTSRQLLSTAEAATLPASRPVGAFRGGLTGFLLGSLVAGGSAYFYLVKEYKLANEMLTEDIYALQAATQRLNSYVTELENKMDQLQRKKK